MNGRDLPVFVCLCGEINICECIEAMSDALPPRLPLCCSAAARRRREGTYALRHSLQRDALVKACLVFVIARCQQGRARKPAPLSCPILSPPPSSLVCVRSHVIPCRTPPTTAAYFPTPSLPPLRSTCASPPLSWPPPFPEYLTGSTSQNHTHTTIATKARHGLSGP